MWLGGDATFKSFKAESDWGYTPDSKIVVFTATNTLNSGESVKFGLITNEKVTGINWKALDQNDNEIDKRKTSIQEISHTTPSFIEEESEAVEQAKETGSALYGTKKFIPEKLRVGSDVRLAGNGFGADEELKLYLDTTILKSINTDEQGNFLTTISIPNTYDTGTSEFIIKDESGNFQSTNINIEEQKNRFLLTCGLPPRRRLAGESLLASIRPPLEHHGESTNRGGLRLRGGGSSDERDCLEQLGGFARHALQGRKTSDHHKHENLEQVYYILIIFLLFAQNHTA